MAFRRILVATDGTEVALRALQTAVELTSTFRAQLIIVTAVEVPELVARRLSVRQGALEDHVEQTAQKALESSLALLAEAQIGALVKVLVGEPSGVIMAAVEQLAPELVVMGRASREEPKAFVLGTVSDRLCRQVRTPLLLVP